MPSATTPSIASVRSHPAVTKKLTQESSYMSKIVKEGFKTVMISANDTDVLVIAVATFSHRPRTESEVDPSA